MFGLEEQLTILPAQCTVLMDCCHSGTALDLPYRFSADDTKMRLDQRMNMDNYLGKFDVQEVLCCALLGCLVMDLLSMSANDKCSTVREYLHA